MPTPEAGKNFEEKFSFLKNFVGPDDVNYKKWIKDRLENFRAISGTSENVKLISEVKPTEIDTFRFYKGLVKVFEENLNLVNQEIVLDAVAKFAGLKARLVRGLQDPAIYVGEKSSQVKLSPIENELLTELNSDCDLKETLDGKNSEIPEEFGNKFDAHGIAKGTIKDQMNSLVSFLKNGIDQTRDFHTAPLKGSLDAAIALGSDRAGAKADGSFMLVGKPGKLLKDNGIALVLLNWQYRESAPILAKMFPEYLFATPEGARSALEHLMKNT